MEAGDPWALACEFMLGPTGHVHLERLPDEARVTLSETTSEQYTPPRCRKPRTRMVDTQLGAWTLGDFRRAQEKS
jgi:hypothetical protein